MMSCAEAGGSVVVVAVVGGTRQAISEEERQSRTSLRPGLLTTCLPSGTANGSGHGGQGLPPRHRNGQKPNVHTPSRLPSRSHAALRVVRKHPSTQAK